MQEEVTKHSRKIYKTAKSTSHSFGEKLKEIIIEILIIVFAVSLSIWLHGWSEHRHEQKEAAKFLKGLREDLTEDISLLEKNREVIAGLDSNFQQLLLLKNNQGADSIASHGASPQLYFDLRVTRPNIGRYEGFKSSGKIETIENVYLKDRILKFYQQTMPDLRYGEDFVNTLQSKILDLQIDSDKIPVKDFVGSVKVQSLLNLGAQNLKVNMGAYSEAIGQAKDIIAEIDKEIK